MFLQNISSFDLFTNQTRKLKGAESNQAKASLTKLWLATDEINGYVFSIFEFFPKTFS